MAGTKKVPQGKKDQKLVCSSANKSFLLVTAEKSKGSGKFNIQMASANTLFLCSAEIFI
jgi:hypothetical protein